MNRTPPQDLLGMLEAIKEDQGSNPLNTFLKKVVQSASGNSFSDSDCPDDVEDCGEVVSPCCGSGLSTVSGTFPLEVQCKRCGWKYQLGPLIRASVKKV